MNDFSGYALGKRRPSNAPALMLADVLTGVVPETPETVDHFARTAGVGWLLGRNDEFGTCGPTSVANHLLLTTAYLAPDDFFYATEEDIFDLYRRSGNPRFDPSLPSGDPEQDDNGVIMQAMLGELLDGGIGGRKPLAFARIAPGDMDTLDKAVAIFGGVLLGVDLRVPQQHQPTWDASGGPEWGGHAVMAGKYYNPEGTKFDRTAVVTWAEEVDVTHDFIAEQEDEAWVVIWPEHMRDATFLEGVDVGALASAYEELTDRPFPQAPPPPVAPEPTPPSPPRLDPVQAAGLAGQEWLRSKQGPEYLRSALQNLVDYLEL